MMSNSFSWNSAWRTPALKNGCSPIIITLVLTIFNVQNKIKQGSHRDLLQHQLLLLDFTKPM